MNALLQVSPQDSLFPFEGLSTSPSLSEKFIESPFVLPTEFCDSNSELIQRALKNILCHSSKDLDEKIRRVFYWVKDSIKYELGLYNEKASETLLKGAGSCSNKANLLNAFLRAMNVPCGFVVMEVVTRKYFGNLSLPRFNQFMSDRSLHVCNFILAQERWIRVDATDDIRLSQGAGHISMQAIPVQFDGRTEAMLRLDPSHILQINSEPIPSIDEILKKKLRLPVEVVSHMNIYMDYLRRFCILHETPADVETSFFQWFQQNDPTEFQKFVFFESKLIESKRKSEGHSTRATELT